MANRFPLVANVSSSRIAELASGDGLDLSGSDIVNAANVTVLGTSTLGDVGNVKITGGTTGQVISTDGTGNLSFVSATVAGSNTQIQYNNNGSFGASGFLTFNDVTRTLNVYNLATTYQVSTTNINAPGTDPLNIAATGDIAIYQNGGSGANILIGFGGPTGGNIEIYGGPNVNVTGNLNVTDNITVGNIIGNGQALTSITGANVSGAVALATSATTAGTVTTAAQPNITSTGTLTSVSISGTATIGNIAMTKFNETLPASTNTSTSISPDMSIGSIFRFSANANFTFNGLTNAVAGSSATIIITQDATGSRTLTSTMKFAGASKTLSTAAGSIDIIGVFYDGTTYYASLTKGYA
jgi:hypothetical protein